MNPLRVPHTLCSLVCLISLLLPALTHAEDPEPIQHPGSYGVLPDDPIKIVYDGVDLTIWRYNTNGGVTFPAGIEWFILPSPPTILWAFDGRHQIRKVTFTSEGIAILESKDNPELWGEAPKIFVQAIPASARRAGP